MTENRADVETAVEQYQREATLYRQLIEKNPDGLLVVDQAGMVRLINPAAARLLGCEVAEIEGKKFDFPLEVDETVELDLVRPDQAEIIVEIRVAEIEWAGEAAYLAAIRDITERQRMLLRHSEEQYRRATEQSHHLEGLAQSRQTELLAANQQLEREIAERRRVEEALRREQKLFVGGPVVVFKLSAQDNWPVKYVSPNVAQFGYLAADFMSGKILYASLIHREDLGRVVAKAKEYGKAGVPYFEQDYRIHRANGDVRWVYDFTMVLRNEYGQVTHYDGYILDITERKAAEESLRHYAERLQVIHEIDQTILASESPKAVAQAALSHLLNLVPCQRASVIEFEDEADRARVLTTYLSGKTRLSTGTLVPLEKSNLRSLHQGEVHLVEDIMLLPDPSPLEEALLKEGVRSYILAPLIFQDELLGILNLEATTPNVLTAGHTEIAGEVATSLAVALRQARLYEQTRQDAQTKEVLLHEVNHRVQNNLMAIIGLLYAEQDHAGIENLEVYQAVIADLITRIEGLAAVHRLLSASEWQPLLLHELADEVIEAALLTLPPDKEVSVEIAPSAVRVTPKQANSLALVLNELATNTLKYALAGRPHARITVEITPAEDRIEVEFRDDGPGYPEEVLRLERHSVGLYLIQNIVQYDLLGTLALQNSHGAVTLIRFQTRTR